MIANKLEALCCTVLPARCHYTEVLIRQPQKLISTHTFRINSTLGRLPRYRYNTPVNILTTSTDSSADFLVNLVLGRFTANFLMGRANFGLFLVVVVVFLLVLEGAPPAVSTSDEEEASVVATELECRVVTILVVVVIVIVVGLMIR